ncbi:MAG: RnfABCDGE type electron transport complex subunit A [Clostridiales bacterium]|nr:RnfABCDGE type electron transport complex subunit A [Clostridiales bacterium]
MSMFFIFVGAALINNFILTQFLGVCPFLGVSKKMNTAIGMGLSVLFVMTIGAALTHVVYHQILARFGIEFLQTVVFILIISSIVQFIELYMKKMFKSLYDMLGIFLPLMTTNCAIMGVALINIRDTYSFAGAMFNSVGAGSGFLLAIIILAAIREKYDNHPSIPVVFQGFPLALFSTGLMSIAFMGFQGLI